MSESTRYRHYSSSSWTFSFILLIYRSLLLVSRLFGRCHPATSLYIALPPMADDTVRPSVADLFGDEDDDEVSDSYSTNLDIALYASTRSCRLHMTALPLPL